MTVPMINLPQYDSVNQIANTVSQGNLTDIQARGLQQDQRQRQGAFNQSQIQDYQERQQEYEAKKTVYWGSQAAAAAQAPLAMRPQIYASMYEKAKASGEDVSNFPLPSENWTDAQQGTLDFIAQSAVEPAKQLEMQQKQQIEQRKLTKGIDKPSAVREFEYFEGLNPQKQQSFLNVKRNVLQTGLGYNEEGDVIPLRGAVDAKEKIKASESRGTALGKSEAETIEAIKSQESKLPNLMKVVDELSSLSKTATYTKVGIAKDNALRQTGQKMSKGGIARARYTAMVDNQVLPLLRDTFGAAFTVEEGKSLRATLGDPDKSPLEKQEVLDAFIAQKNSNLAAMKEKLNINPRAGNKKQEPQDLQGLSDDDLMKQLGL
tara:strand:+ start:343 stop:1470 length:1128 start_codon:yes stop_codon:yes gene_type:complete